MYQMTYEEIDYIVNVLKDKTMRTNAKAPVLGCGYRLSAGRYVEDEKTGEWVALGLLGYAQAMGIELTVGQCEHAVRTFRETFPEVKRFWFDIEDVVKNVIRDKKARTFRMFKIEITGPFLRITLPSGRGLYYFQPRLKMRPMPWDENDYREQITYMGENDNKQWVRVSTHGGKLLENCSQAISRDVLAHGIQKSLTVGIDVRLHVHDQIVALVNEETADEELATLIECMEDRPEWAKGFPLKSEGFLSKVLKKD